MSDLSGKVGLDTTDFKTGIKEAERSLKVIESGFKASAAALGDWAKDATGLETRIDSLTKSIDLQEGMVKALREEHARMVAEEGAGSKSAQDMEIRLNKATEALNKNKTELKGASQALADLKAGADGAGSEVQDLGKKEDVTAASTDKLKEKSGGLGAALKAAGAAVAGLAVGVAAIGAGVGKMVLGTAEAADGLDEMSKKTGISTTKLQELNYAAGQVGIDASTVTGSMAKLTKSMSAAADETAKTGGALNDLKMGATGEAFYRMNIAVTDSTGGFRNAQAVYKDAVKALSEIKNPVDRDITSMAIFGTTFNQISLKTLPTLTKNMGTAATQLDDYSLKMSQLQDTAGPTAGAFKQLGVSITDASGNLRSRQDVFNEAITALGKISNETERDALAMTIFGKSAMELNPLISAGADEFARLSQEAHDMGAVLSEEDVEAAAGLADQLDGLKKSMQGTVMQISTAFLPAISAIATKVGGYMKTFAGIVKGSDGDLKKMTAGTAGLVKQITTDIAAQAPQLLQGGLSIVQGVAQAMVQSIPTLLPAIVTMLVTLVQFIIENIPMLIEAGVQILLALVNGLATALPQLIPVVVQIIPQIVTTLISNLPLIINAALQLIIALATGLIAALPVLIPRIPEIIKAMFDAIIQALPLIAQAALKLIETLAKGLIDNLPMIVESGVKLIGAIKQGIDGVMQGLWDAGVNIVKGIWNGINSQGEIFRQQVLSFFTGIVDGVKKFLGIASPSKVFAGIGLNMAAGLGVGFTNQFKQIERDISGAVGNMQVGGVNIATGASGISSGSSGGRIEMGGIHITVTGNADPTRVGRAAEQGVLRALRATGAV
jgi:TP901 family phage tail tape measure protein